MCLGMQVPCVCRSEDNCICSLLSPCESQGSNSSNKCLYFLDHFIELKEILLLYIPLRP